VAHARQARLQRLLYAHDRYSLLVIFQAMDAAGKDGAIRHVMSGVNPQGCQVFSFKHPSEEELDHDFLWRTRRRAARARAHRHLQPLVLRGGADRARAPEILRGQQLPDETLARRTSGATATARSWTPRPTCTATARASSRCSCTCRRTSSDDRLIARIDEEDKNWKFDEGDIEQRQHWDKYMAAYADCLSATSSAIAPWYVVPADDKKNTRLIISRIILDLFRGLEMAYPEPSKKRRRELRSIRRELEREGAA
jgi:hypothetical protein